MKFYISVIYQPAVRHSATNRWATRVGLITRFLYPSPNLTRPRASLQDRAIISRKVKEVSHLFASHPPNITARRHNIRLASTKEQRYWHKSVLCGSCRSHAIFVGVVYPTNALSVNKVHPESIQISNTLAQPHFALQSIRPQKA